MSGLEKYVYRCRKHKYELVDYNGSLGAQEMNFCPRCLKEFYAKHVKPLEREKP